MSVIRIAGIDPSFTHTGVAKFDMDLTTFNLKLVGVNLFVTENGANKHNKTVRKNSDDLRRCYILKDGLDAWLRDCELAFSEVPHGAQSARAAVSNGVVYMMLAYIPCPLIQVQASETKILGVGIKNADKKEVIEWAIKRYPEAAWHTRKLKGQVVPIADNEHMADACAVAVAGVQTAEFKRTIAMLGAMRRTSALTSPNI